MTLILVSDMRYESQGAWRRAQSGRAVRNLPGLERMALCFSHGAIAMIRASPAARRACSLRPSSGASGAGTWLRRSRGSLTCCSTGPAEKQEACTVVFFSEDKACQAVAGEDLLGVALRLSAPVNLGCCSGSCGVCEVRTHAWRLVHMGVGGGGSYAEHAHRLHPRAFCPSLPRWRPLRSREMTQTGPARRA